MATTPERTSPRPPRGGTPRSPSLLGRRTPTGRGFTRACALAALLCASLPAVAKKPTPGLNLEVATPEDTLAEGQLAAPRPGETLQLKLKRAPKHGQATLDAQTGGFRYQPDKDFNGDDAFSVDVGVGARGTSVAVTVHVAAENDAPTARGAALTAQEDGAGKVSLEARDVDGDLLTYALTQPPAHGQARVEPRSGAVTYRPAPDFHGADSFTVEVSDGALTAEAPVSVTVAPVNDAPLVRGAAHPCSEDSPCQGLAAATDVDGDALTWRLVSPTQHGAVTVEAGSGAFTFTPAANFHGDDAFTVEVSDGKLKAKANVTLQVASVNDAPVAAAVAVATLEDAPVSGQVVGSDLDGDALTYRVGVAPQHGAATVEPRTGAFTYQPAADFFGADTFTVEVGDGAATVSAPVSVSMASVNDAPVASAGAAAFDEDTPFAGTCAANDVDGDALAFQVGRTPKHGELTLEPRTGAFRYQPARDYQGPDSFTFKVSDGKLESEAVVRLSVRPVNDVPVAAALSLATQEDEPVYAAVAASDVDGQPLRYEVGTPAEHGAAKVDPRTGAVSYTPARDFHGVDRFTVSVSDGAARTTAAVEVALTPVDDAPVTRPLALSTQEDTATEGALPGADVDGDALTFRLLGPPRVGAVTLLDAATGAFRFTPHPDANGDDVVAFEVSDGRTTARGVVQVRVAPVNDAPTVAALALSTREDVQVGGALRAADVDGDALTWAIESQPASGKAFVDAAGKVRFEPAQDQNGTARFTVVVRDGALTSAPAPVVVEISPVNDAPVARAGAVRTNEDTVAEGVLPASDVDGDALVFEVTRPPAHGTVTVTDVATGKYLYNPAPNFNGEDSFGFAVKDPAGVGSAGEMKVTVVAVNDAPVAVADDLSGPCNGQLTGQLKGYDRESAPLTFSIVGKPAQGKLKLVDPRSGQFVFDTEGARERELTFQFVVSDGALSSAPADLTVHSTCGGS